MAAVTDPPLPPWPRWLGGSGAGHSQAPVPPRRKVLGLGACREGLDPSLGEGSDPPFPSLSEMEEPQWPIPEPPLSHPAPNLTERHKERAVEGVCVSCHVRVLVSGWHSSMAPCRHPWCALRAGQLPALSTCTYVNTCTYRAAGQAVSCTRKGYWGCWVGGCSPHVPCTGSPPWLAAASPGSGAAGSSPRPISCLPCLAATVGCPTAPHKVPGLGEARAGGTRAEGLISSLPWLVGTSIPEQCSPWDLLGASKTLPTPPQRTPPSSRPVSTSSVPPVPQ